MPVTQCGVFNATGTATEWTCPGQCVHVPRQAGVKRASHTGMGCHSDSDSESESAQESAHVHAPQAPGRCSSCAQATASTASGTGIMMMHWQPGARAAGACTGGRGPNWHWQSQLSGVRAPSSPGLPCTCCMHAPRLGSRRGGSHPSRARPSHWQARHLSQPEARGSSFKLVGICRGGDSALNFQGLTVTRARVKLASGPAGAATGRRTRGRFNNGLGCGP